MRALNVQAPDAVARVTEHMAAITQYIAGIERNGLAYRTGSSGVYFDVRAFSQR
jgi:cysteinyl-tRNA synthetase